MLSMEDGLGNVLQGKDFGCDVEFGRAGVDGARCDPWESVYDGWG